MITVERVKEKLKWLSDVSGQAIKHNMADALWEEFQYADLGDFDKAIKEMSFSDEKINLANISKRIAHVRAARLEKEASERQRKEEEATRQWFRDHSGTSQTCINKYQCGQCERVYCDIVSKDCSMALKKMLSGEITAEEMHKMLANKFHGIGFERNVAEMEVPF